MMMSKPRSPKHDDVELASLRFAFLKENSGYRKFVEENRDRILCAYSEWRSAVREGRAPNIPAVDRFGKEIPLEDMFKEFFEPVAYTHVWFHKCLEEGFGILNPPFDVSMLSADGRREVLTPEESLDLLDPMKDIENVPKERRETALRGMFSACGIRHVVHNHEEALLRRLPPSLGIPQTVQDDENREGSTEQASISVFELEQREKQQRRYESITSGGVSPWFKRKLVPFPLSGLLPHERLLVVDLRKKKSELLKEFGVFFDRVKYHRENTRDSEWGKNYSRWELDTTRTRDEAWQPLRIWKLRREKKGYAAIARIMEMTVGAVKMSFYKAHKIIEGFPYDREKYKLKHWNLRECASCKEHPDRGGPCKELCPDAKEKIGIPEDIYLHQVKEPEMMEQKHIHAEWLTKKARGLQSEEDEQD